MFTLAQGPHLCEPRRTITPGKRKPPGGSPASGKAVARALRAPCLPVSSFGTTFPSPAPRPGGPQTQPCECRRGCPQPLREPRRRVASPSPHPRSPCPRFRFRSTLGTTPPGAEALSPRAPQPPRPVLTSHPVHVGRHGRSRRRLRPHKGVREARGGRARFETKPGAWGWRFAEVSVKPAQPAPPLPQPSRFISVGAVAAAATASHQGRRGRRRSARLLPERARLPPAQSQAPESPALAEPHHTSGSAGRGEG